jgi:hypothetical protein
LAETSPTGTLGYRTLTGLFIGIEEYGEGYPQGAIECVQVQPVPKSVLEHPKYHHIEGLQPVS